MCMLQGTCHNDMYSGKCAQFCAWHGQRQETWADASVFILLTRISCIYGTRWLTRSPRWFIFRVYPCLSSSALCFCIILMLFCHTVCLHISSSGLWYAFPCSAFHMCHSRGSSWTIISPLLLASIVSGVVLSIVSAKSGNKKEWRAAIYEGERWMNRQKGQTIAN